MSPWKTLRISLLATTFGGVVLVLGKSILSPSAGYTVSPFVFPETVPLPEWQPLASSSLDNPTAKGAKFVSGRLYRYIQNDQPLNIEMRYLVNTDGDVNTLIKDYMPSPSSDDKLSPVLRQQKGVGIYNLFVQQGKAYLSACINPSGLSTVTGKQFRQNRNTYDVGFSRLLVWLLAQGQLRDDRCVWAHLSVPLNNSSQKDSYQTLEKAWISWYQWWSPRFPKP